MAEKVEIQWSPADYAGSEPVASKPVAQYGGIDYHELGSEPTATQPVAQYGGIDYYELGTGEQPIATAAGGANRDMVDAANVSAGANRDMIDAANVSYGASSASRNTGFDLSSIKPVWSSIGGVRTVNLGAGLDLDFENNDYTFRQTRDDDGNIVSTVVEAPENARELGMSLIKKYDPETGSATYSKPEAPEASVAQSLYKSPQFMAPVTASVVNGLFQMLISERMAKAQRDEQRRMLDAQFQVLEKKEEANEEKKRRFASIYASLQAERKRKG
jgi:hypothetical protein